MADSVKNTDVEDVLSSIRRLVSESSSNAGADKASADDAEQDNTVVNEALLLTSSQRVNDTSLHDQDTDNADETGELETADLGELRLALKRKAEEAKEEASDVDAAEMDEDSDHPLFSKLPKSRLHLSEAMSKSPVSENHPFVTAPGFLPENTSEEGDTSVSEGEADAADVVDATSDDSAFDIVGENASEEPAESWTVKLPDDYYEDEVETNDTETESDVWIVDADEATELAETTAQIYDFDSDRVQDTDEDGPSLKSVEASEADEPTLVDEKPEGEHDAGKDLMILRPELIADENSTPDAEESPVEDLPAEPAPADAMNVSEEALQQMIRDAVRQELTGEMGTAITKNLRQLVRREVYRALATQEFD